MAPVAGEGSLTEAGGSAAFSDSSLIWLGRRWSPEDVRLGRPGPPGLSTGWTALPRAVVAPCPEPVFEETGNGS